MNPEDDYDITTFRHRLALRGDLSWMLWDQQVPIYRAIRGLPQGIDEYVVLCARQFGKSHLGVLCAIEDAIRYRDVCILITGPNTKQTKDIVNPRMRRIAQYLPEGLLVPAKADNKWILYHALNKKQQDYTEIVIGGMNENSSSQRGKTLQNAYIEEVVDANEDDYMQCLRSDIGPALSHSKSGKIIYLTTLPKTPDHPFITDTLANARLNNALAVFTIDDNKMLTTEQYKASVRRCGGRETDEFKREHLCQIIRDSSVVVVPAFQENRHIVRIVLPSFHKWNIMIDWGGVRDYTVGLLYTYDFVRNKILIHSEFMFKENTPTSTIWTRTLEWRRAYDVPIEATFADAPGQTLVDLSSLFNDAVSAPNKADWQASINNLNVLFGMDRIEVDPSCTFLIESLRSGVFNKQRTDFERTKALGHCDALAALMYAVRHYNNENPYPDRHSSADHYYIPATKEEDGFAPDAFGKGFGRYGKK